MTTSRWLYGKALAEQLRINGVAEAQVREIVAQVESHIRDSGEDPVAAFGQPVDYAAQWQRLTARRWLTQVLPAVVLSAGAVGIGKAVMSDRAWGETVVVEAADLATFGVFVVLLALMPWTVDLWLARRRGARLGETSIPRDWPVTWAALVALGVALTLATVLIGEPSTRTLFEVPRWLLLAWGITTLPVLLFSGPDPGQDDHPRPPGRAGDPPPWRSRVRRAFLNR